MRKLAVKSSLPGSPRPEVGSGFWKLSDQPLIVPVPPVVELFVDGQHPGSLHAHAIGRGCEYGGQRLLRVERGEERCAAVLDRRGRVVVEDRVVEIGGRGAGPHAAEQGHRAQLRCPGS